MLCEHSLSGEVAGLTVDAPWIPVAFAVGHVVAYVCGGCRDACFASRNLRLCVRLGGLHGTRGYEYAPPEKGVKPAGRRKVLEGCLGVPCIERQHYHFRRVALPVQAPQGLAPTRYCSMRTLIDMGVSSIISKAKELFGLSWSSAINCFGAVCGWIVMGHMLTGSNPFVFLDDALHWLDFTNTDVFIVESYIQNHAALFSPLAVLLLVMVGFFAWSENSPTNLLEGTYGAVFWIGILLAIVLGWHWIFITIVIVSMTIEMWIHSYLHTDDSEYKLLGAFVFAGLLVFTALYPVLLLARIMFP